MMKRFLFLLLGAAAYAGGEPSRPPLQLALVLRTPVDIDLTWNDTTPSAGHVVEFRIGADDPFIPLGFFPGGGGTMTHPRLVPHTTFHYRVRPYYGPVSNA